MWDLYHGSVFDTFDSLTNQDFRFPLEGETQLLLMKSATFFKQLLVIFSIMRMKMSKQLCLWPNVRFYCLCVLGGWYLSVWIWQRTTKSQHWLQVVTKKPILLRLPVIQYFLQVLPQQQQLQRVWQLESRLPNFSIHISVSFLLLGTDQLYHLICRRYWSSR